MPLPLHATRTTPNAPERTVPRASDVALARQRQRSVAPTTPTGAGASSAAARGKAQERPPRRLSRTRPSSRAVFGLIAAVSIAFSSIGSLGGAAPTLAQGEQESPAPTADPTPKPTPTPTPKPTPWPTPQGVKGLDVSHWNGTPDFVKLRNAGMRFVFSKASQGTTFVDDTFKRNTRAARNAGLIAGAYHFFDYNKGGRAQARHFLHTVRSTTGLSALLPLVVDVETLGSLGTPNKTKARGRLHALIDELYARTGRYPMIYTSRHMWQQVVGSPTSFGRYPLWVACWKCDTVHLPSGWRAWDFWQVGQFKFSFSPKLDVNVWRSSYRQLKLQRQRPMRIDDGAEWSVTRAVESDLRGFQGSSVRYAIGSGSWSDWKPYQDRFDVRLWAKQGRQDVKVQLRSFRGVTSPVLKDSIKLDDQSPTMWGPRVSLRQSARVPKDGVSVPTHVDMGAKDSGSGLHSTSVRVECDGSVRGEQTWQTGTNGLNVHLDRKGCTLHGQALDNVQNERIGTLAPRLQVLDLKRSTTRATFGAGWTIVKADQAVGSSLARTSARGATVKVDIEGSQFAVVVRRGPSGGRLKVIVDGTHVATVDLYASSGDQRRIIHVGNVPAGKHTVKLRTTGTKRAASTGTTVWLDAVLVLDRRK